MRKIAFVIVAAATLAGCDTGPSRQDFLASLVGHPESDAIRALGAPTHLIEANGHRFLAYQDSGVGYVPSAPFGPFGYGYYGPIGIPIVRTCETTLEVVGGQVVSFTLRGNSCG